MMLATLSLGSTDSVEPGLCWEEEDCSTAGEEPPAELAAKLAFCDPADVVWVVSVVWVVGFSGVCVDAVVVDVVVDLFETLAEGPENAPSAAWLVEVD
jgi:hypothetical protein